MTFIFDQLFRKRKAFSANTAADRKQHYANLGLITVERSRLMAYNVLISGDKWGKVGKTPQFIPQRSYNTIAQMY
jgi:hypothetical protein